MLYRVETGPRAGLDDTQGRKTAQHLRKALNISVSGVRQIKVFTADGLDAAQVARLLDDQNALQVSYQALATVRQLNLMNYMK